MNHYQVVYSRQALQDLERVWDEVYEVSKSRNIASDYIDDFMNQIQQKEMFPRSGIPLNYGDFFTGYYFIVFKAYAGFYHIAEKQIRVDRILSTKSEYLKQLNIQ